MNAVLQRIRALPWWVRVPIGIAGLALLLKLSVAWLVEDITDVATEAVDIEYRGSFYDWKGHFGTNDVVIRGYDADGNPADEYAMDRLVIRPSSQLWLLRNAFTGGGTRWVPDTIGLSFENFRATSDGETTPGNYTNLPYDAKGCVPLLLTPRDIMAMGLPAPRRDLHVQLERQSMGLVDAVLTSETAGMGRLSIRATVELDWPVRMKKLVEELAEAPLRSVTLTFDDLGFVAARNRACAAKRGLDADAFDAYHLQEVHRRLGEEGIGFGAAALEQYAHFARHGGSLAIRSAGTPDLTLGEFFLMDRGEKLQAFPLRIAAADRAPVDLGFAVGPARKAPSPVAAVPAGTAAVAVRDAAPVVRTLPAAGAEVAYDDAAALVGEHVHVRTRYGSDRRGTLLVHTSPMITMKLDAVEGGFTLTLNRQDVASIRYTPARAVAGVGAGSH